MNSVLIDDDRKSVRMKPNAGNEKIPIDLTSTTVFRDEARSFLNFSPENLSISQSELEQGFNKSSRCFRPNGQSLLSLFAIFVALVCASMEIWKFHRVVSNSRDIEIMKRDIESLRHRLFGEHFMDELKAFEEQLYGDGSDGDDDSSEADIDSADYYNNYDQDYSPSWNDYVSDSNEPTSSTQSLVFRPSRGSSKSEQLTSTSLSPFLEFLELLAVRDKKRNQKLEKGIPANQQNMTKKVPVDEHHDDAKNIEKHSKRRRAVTEEIPFGYTKFPMFSVYHSNRTTTEAPWDRHPPKKYFAIRRTDDSNGFSNSRQASRRHRGSSSHRKNQRRLHQENNSSELTRRSLKPRAMTRRHLRAPKQVFAAHYGADSALFGIDDEHTGNGRAKHNEGIYKAWRPSEWVTDLGMSKHFLLSRDGRLTVHEPGLYLVYGQIHYLDEHDENGFHILVNGKPILQCMVYSPGTGHKSRSCFSAQITVLQADDHLVIKDVGPARYTLFQHDKSFFGLVKIGDSRQQQQQQTPRQTTEETLR